MNNRLIYGKHFLLIFLFPLIFFANGMAQEEVKATVYLKNGSIVSGVIVELIQDSILKIRVMEANVFVFEWERIDKLEIGSAVSSPSETTRVRSQSRDKRTTPVKYKEPGYINTTELGFMIGSTSFFTNSVALSFSNINGWYFNRHIQVGIGVGLDRYVNDGSLVPIFADFRGEVLKKKRISPFWFGSAGYSLGFLNKSPVFIKYNGGLMVQGGLGLKFYSRQKSAFFFSLGYRMQKSHKIYEEMIWDTWFGQSMPTGNIVDISTTYRRFLWVIGVSF